MNQVCRFRIHDVPSDLLSNRLRCAPADTFLVHYGLIHRNLTWSRGFLTCVCDLFAWYTHTGDFGLQCHPKDFCRVCADFGSKENLKHVMVTHPFGDARSCLTLVFVSEYSCSALTTPTLLSTHTPCTPRSSLLFNYFFTVKLCLCLPVCC